VVLHIGPHKTGTSAIQAALAAARPELAAFGVAYPGRGVSHNLEARSALDIPTRVGKPHPKPDLWPAFAREVASQRGRVVVSSENFDNADPAEAEQIVAALGGERVHVLVTLRSLPALLPSAYQQTVKGRNPLSYESWLERVFDRDTGEMK